MSHGNEVDLHQLARQAMKDRGLIPDFSGQIRREVEELGGPARDAGDGIRDMTAQLWFSIDNDDSRDLDQLTYAEEKGAKTRVYVAVADVDALVHKGSATDQRAAENTTSVYTAGGIFPMLPEELSTDWSSLNEDEDRLALVIQYDVDADGHLEGEEVYRARVHNHAKLAYNNVAAWLEGKDQLPKKLDDMKPLEQQLRMQHAVADRLRERRHENGALDLQSLEARAVTKDGKVVDLQLDEKNDAKELIEDFMIASNGVVARFLEKRRFPVFRRVVRTPERWNKIVDVAATYGEVLPSDPDSLALEHFLQKRRKADPLRFPDLSLTIVKLLGRGEYVIDPPGEEAPGHFGLAVRDYSHSTAPNRRYPDLITHRMVKAALGATKNPYRLEELEELAEHCTKREDDANKVERFMRKAAGALLMQDRIGQSFEGIVTGAAAKGTWVRIFHPPVEGRVVRGEKGLDVGDKVRVKLVSADPERGFIDFSH
jgi:exoribonuclease-2